MFFDYVKNKKVSVHYESGFAFDIVYPERMYCSGFQPVIKASLHLAENTMK